MITTVQNHLNQQDLEKERILKEMAEAKVCFGHSASRLHPRMKPFVAGVKNTQTIINLEKTYDYLIKARELFSSLKKEGKTILFVNTNPATNDITEAAATKTSNPFITNRWIGGFLTNFPVISKRIAYFNELKKKKESGELEKYTKKEQLKFEEELEELEELFAGVKNCQKLPDAIFVIDAKIHQYAVKEAQRIGIPIIALVNTDNDPTGIVCPIPASDLHRSSVEYITNFIIND
ncbi:MAG: 30S ribosomal protein S2 [Patescibacteria group bacterium]|jgi:small subunit ribosomal protein S2|nr:30S ribosomal protein S2 [Patescibacteria group bacterium]